MTMTLPGWWEYTVRTDTIDDIDTVKTRIPVGVFRPSNAPTFGNSQRSTASFAGSFTITKDGTGNLFPSWGGAFKSFGNFRIEYKGRVYPLNVAQGNMSNGQYSLTDYEIGPYKIQVDTGYMGPNMYRMTISEASNERPSLVFKMDGKMGAGETTMKYWVHTYTLNGQTNDYLVAVNNSADPLVSQTNPIVYMTVISAEGPIGNQFSSPGTDVVSFNQQGAAIKLPFTVYICAHKNGVAGRDGFISGITNDNRKLALSGHEAKTDQWFYSKVREMPTLRQFYVDKPVAVIKGNASCRPTFQLTSLTKTEYQGPAYFYAPFYFYDETGYISLDQLSARGYQNYEGIYHG